LSFVIFCGFAAPRALRWLLSRLCGPHNQWEYHLGGLAIELHALVFAGRGAMFDCLGEQVTA